MRSRKASPNPTRGFTILETLIAIALAAMLFSVYASVLGATVFHRRIQGNFQASNFIQEELDVLRALPFSELLNRTDGRFLGIPLQRGPWQVQAVAGAPSGANGLAMTAAQTAVIEETGLAVVPGNYRGDFTYVAHIKVLGASPAGWGAGLAFRYRDAENHYRFRFTSGGIALDKIVQGAKTTIWSQSATYNKDVWYKLEVVAAGSSLTLKKNDATLTALTDTVFTEGDLALMALNAAQLNADSVSVTEGGTTTWNFDADAVGSFPADWTRMSYLDLPGGTGTLTLENYLGQTNLKQATVVVSWNDATTVRTMTGTTLISN